MIYKIYEQDAHCIELWLNKIEEKCAIQIIDRPIGCLSMIELDKEKLSEMIETLNYIKTNMK